MIPLATNLEDFHAACYPLGDLEGGRTHPYYQNLAPGGVQAGLATKIRTELRRISRRVGGETVYLRVLLTGPQGTGKTTELNSLETDLHSDGYFVVRFSARVELNLQDLGWQDLLLEMATQISVQGSAACSKGEIQATPDTAHLREMENLLARTSLTEIARTKAVLEAEGVAGVKSPLPFLNLGATFKSLWQSGSERTREVRREIEPQAGPFKDALNKLVDAFRDELIQEGKKGLILIVDDLEKLDFSLDGRGHACALDLFVHNADCLKAPHCHVIYTVPISLRYDYDIAGLMAPSVVLMTPMLRVRTRVRTPDPDGVQTMRAALALRGNLDLLAEDEAIAEIIARSGGHLRDLLRLVQYACDEALANGEERISLATARSGGDRFANETYALVAHNVLDELCEVYRTQHLPKQQADLADRLLVFLYLDPDGEPWHDVHPSVLRLRRLRNALNLQIVRVE